MIASSIVDAHGSIRGAGCASASSFGRTMKMCNDGRFELTAVLLWWLRVPYVLRRQREPCQTRKLLRVNISPFDPGTGKPQGLSRNRVAEGSISGSGDLPQDLQAPP
ncbi:hypothetical protein DNTS_035017 [Danionella cerebrum]|uniref:Uncharacterized protein n=1 Tax=Danionella cerebrum TaxID=2873325 RepID=A0A553R3C5_9TELE|nr:hypothetical protein DNTS_035017 [Danionella translucida]